MTVMGYDRHIRLRKRKKWKKRSMFPKIMAANFFRTKKICKLTIEDAHSLCIRIDNNKTTPKYYPQTRNSQK